MSDTTSDELRFENLKARLATFGEELKAEVATAIDQKLDELGAQIGAD